MKELNGTGPVASPIEATRCPVPSAMSWSTTGGPCSRKSALPARKVATASGVESSRMNVTRAGSTPWRRRTACMQSHGVGAPPDEIRPREAGAWLPAQEKEPVAIVHRGEVDEARALTLEELEAPHEAPEGEVCVAVQQRVHRAASLSCRRERDLEAFRREMAAVNRDELGRVEERAEGLDDPEADGRHGSGTVSSDGKAPAPSVGVERPK